MTQFHDDSKHKCEYTESYHSTFRPLSLGLMFTWKLIAKEAVSCNAAEAEFVKAWFHIAVNFIVIIIISGTGTVPVFFFRLFFREKIISQKTVLDFSDAEESKDTCESSHPRLKLDCTNLLLLLQIYYLRLQFRQRNDACYLNSEIDVFSDFYEEFFGACFTH